MIRSSFKSGLAGTCLIVMALGLSACGGGGGGSNGGSGGGTPTPATSFTVDPQSVTATSDTSSATAVFATVAVTVTNAKGTVNLLGQYSNTGIFQITGAQTDTTHFTFDIQFRDAPTLAPGTYDDTLYVKLCADENCAVQFGVTTLVPVHYIVTGTAVPRPHVTVDTTPIDEQTLSFVPAQPASIALNFQGLDSVRAVDRSAATNNAINSISFVGSGGPSGEIVVYFKPDLPVGTYHDVVSTSLCNNDTTQCQEIIPGSQANVSVTLTVADTITGATGYSVRFAPALANGLAWDSQRQVIYATIRNDSDPSQQSIATIDPQSGSVLSTTALAGGPNRLAVSGDGSYLYVGQDTIGAVSRLVLPAMTSDITITLPTDPSLGGSALRAGDIQPSPDDAHAIAVAVAKPPAYTPNCSSLMLFEDTQVRTSLPGNGNDADPCVGSIQWGSSSSVLYADDAEAFPADIYRIAVAPNSMTSALMIPGNDFLCAGPIQYRDGLLFTAGGVIYDTVSGTVVGQLPTPVNQLLRGVFSPETHRVITVDDAVAGLDGIRITAFNTTTFQEVAHIDFPHLYVQQNPDGTSLRESEAWRAIRWGNDGYAVPLTDGRVLIIQGAFIGP